jgi:uncharacterized protein YlxW (UPF0749 family)
VGVGQDGRMTTDRPATPHRVDGSMSLLVDMAAAALDPAYGDAAARKERQRLAVGPTDAPGGGRRASKRVTGLLVVVGVVTGVGAAQVRQRSNDAGSVRSSLVADVRRETALTDTLAREADTLRADVQRVRNQALGDGSRGRSLASQVAVLELVTGEQPVRGPGLVVSLDDAANATDGGATPRGGQLASGRIYDRDVQDAANALWAAGAEAITINGQRLTAQTAIRSAGEAVLVDFRPLAPPYVLRAIGDVDAMEPAFADGAIARRFTTWISLYGIGFDVHRAKDLRLAAASAPDLRVAHPEGNP